MRSRIVTVAAAVVFVPLFSGCLTTERVWAQKRDLEYRLRWRVKDWTTNVQMPIDEVYKAVMAGLSDVGIKPLTNQVDKLSGLVDGVFADQMDFSIKLETLAPKMTAVTLRCGYLPNRDRVTSLFQAIEKHF